MWEEHLSRQHQRPYWFNTQTGERVWERPANVAPPSSSAPSSSSSSSSARDDARKDSEGAAGSDGGAATKKRKRSDGSDDGTAASAAAAPPVKVAVIVPYRDLHQEQSRRKHLDRFIPGMTKVRVVRCILGQRAS
jgi:hypothetical protein